jgi:hypothetical protein
VTWALTVNSHLSPRYAEEAVYWSDYLWAHYQAKWLDRTGAVDPQDPTDAELDAAWHTDSPNGITKNLWHPTSSGAKMAFFFSLIYGNEWHRGEYQRLIDLWLADLVTLDGGARVGWPHRINVDPETDAEGYQRMTYVVYTWITLDLFLAFDLLDDGDLYAAAFANAFAQNGADEMADRIDGTGVDALNPWTLGSAAQYGSYAAIEAACAASYLVTSSLDAELAPWMAAGASEE